MENELYHHGVMGMKWGKRNGPPYPLDAEGKADLREQRKEEKRERKTLKDAAKHDFRYKNTKVVNSYRAQQRTRRDAALAAIGATSVGAAVGGPSGAVVGLALGVTVGSITTGAINQGIKIYENSKYKKMLINDQEFKNMVLKGEEYANATGHHYKYEKGNPAGDTIYINDVPNKKITSGEKRKNADKIAAQYERNTEVVESYTKSARESIKNGDYKKAANTIAQIPYDHFVSETNRLVSEGKTDNEASSIVLSGKTKHGIHPTERLAFDSAEKVLSEIKDPKNREEFLSELSVTMDASQRDNPSVMVYNNNQRKITSYYDTYTVDNELKKNGLKNTGDYNAADLDIIYKSKQRGTNSYYIWGKKVQ